MGLSRLVAVATILWLLANSHTTLLLQARSVVYPGSAAVAPVTRSAPDQSGRIKVLETYGKLPLHFEANQGQTDEQVKFLSRGSGYTLFLTFTGSVRNWGKQ